MLSALLGIDEAEAALRLKLRIAVNFDETASVSRALGEHVIALLSRTVEDAGSIPSEKDVDVEIIIGRRKPSVPAKVRIYAGQHGSSFIVDGAEPLNPPDDFPPLPYLVIKACHISAAALRAALEASFPFGSRQPIVLNWRDLFGSEIINSPVPIEIGETHLAGAGAVGHGFVYTLRYFDVRGKLWIADPKRITEGGLNRCLLLSPDDVGRPKATRLCQSAQRFFPNLELVAIDTLLGDALKTQGIEARLEKLIVGVDSRRARRSLQMELPASVFDASTTGVNEVVLHFNRSCSDLACLSCIYPENQRERQHEENVAEALGLTIDEVRTGFISPAAADRISRKYRELQVLELVGRAFDTVYKELCGVGKLKAVGGEQVLAPFSFVSVLAGAYLAIEFAIRISRPHASRFNYWRLSPWRSPVTGLRQERPRDPACEFCSKPYLRKAMEDLWQIG